jgi:hypothetical protein
MSRALRSNHKTMSILRYFYPRNSLKRKILDIQVDIKREVARLTSEKVWVFWVGAYWIDPMYLAYWVGVETDRAKYELAHNAELIADFRRLLVKHNYPLDARKDVLFTFESQETVDRDAGGDWHLVMQ